MLCGTDDWHMYAFDFGVGNDDWKLHRYDNWNTAFSPDGLTTWQYVKADCTTDDNITTCTVTNYYDHDVTKVKLKLDFNAYWHDSSGDLLKPESDNYVIDSLSNSSSMTFIIAEVEKQGTWCLDEGEGDIAADAFGLSDAALVGNP
jgi:hypothetical protein